MMETYEIPGLFSGSVKIYHYPSIRSSQKVILLLKGIYSEHIPNSSSWDNQLITLLQDDYHIVCLRTSRLNNKVEQDAFLGKTFEQECTEAENAIDYCNKNIFLHHYTWGCVGTSFGGTMLLGSQKILSQMKIVIMIGSGCGRSPETVKPLLSTLPVVEQLLLPLNNYHGTFIFLHGQRDTVVPIDSQKLIYDRAVKNSIKHQWIELPNLDHSLRDIDTKESQMGEIISQYIKENFL